MEILVDMDDVVADFDGGFLREWKKKHSDRIYVPIDERRGQFVVENYPEEYRDDVRKIINTTGFYYSLEPISGMLKGITEMLRYGHSVRLCSSPSRFNPTCHSDKYNWTMNLLGYEIAAKLILTRDKTVVRGDILIDDNPKINGDYEPTWKHIIFDRPHNRNINSVPRMNGWDDWKRAIEETRG